MQNKTLGKLLAKENITIQQGNYHTAWFDIKNRTLGLPMWANQEKDVYDLMIGHEVGHALYTPYEGWHDSPEKLEGCPRSYINVVEDARIEKLVRRSYPGLVGPFLRGYKKLSEDKFFGDLENLDYNQIKLIDKINLKSKLGRAISIPFNSIEQDLFNRTMITETFGEVVELVKEILAYTKENQSELMEPPEENEEELLEDTLDAPTGHDDMESSNPSEQTKSENDETANKSEAKDEDTSFENTDELEAKDEDEKGTSSNTLSPTPTHNRDEDQSITDKIFRAKEAGLVKTNTNGEEKLYSSGISKDIAKLCIIDHKTLATDRLDRSKRYNDDTINKNKVIFNQYMKDTRKNVNFAIKEFEMRKAAHQWQRATTAKSGSLDVNKVHSYKFNEDIFAKVTSLADAKNHGMVMLVDYSGSMTESLTYVLDQLMHLVIFCKAVNIPFEVYAFTTGNPTFQNRQKEELDDLEGAAYDKKLEELLEHNKNVDKNMAMFKDASLMCDDLSMPLLVSSDLKKSEYIVAMQNLHSRMVRCGWSEAFISRYEQWGSTPLNQALVVSHEIIKKFKIKHAVEKMNFICLTDGDTNHLQVYQCRKLKQYKTPIERGYYHGLNITVDGKTIALPDNGTGGTKALLKNIQKRYNTKTLGFFMADDNRHFYNRIQAAVMDDKDTDYIDYYSTTWQNIKKDANAEYKKNKCVVKNNVLGYSEYYIIKGGANLSAQDNDAMEGVDVKTGSTTAQVRNAFKKQAKSKKVNKVLLTRFGKVVA